MHSDEKYVKKAVSWVLRELGKTNIDYQNIVVKFCYENINSPNKNTQWIMKDVLKEVEKLVEVDDRKRLINNSSKMAMKRNK